MKKISIIAGLVYTTVFFVSCESNEIRPKVSSSNPAIETVDFMEPEFASQKRPNGITAESVIAPTSTEIMSAVENKVEQ